jgi:acetyl esterase/lipase
MERRMMSPWIAPCLILLVAFPSSAAEDARTILDKAIKAHGGEAKLAKLKTMTGKAKGTANLGGKGNANFGAELSFNFEISWQWPDRLKNAVTLRILKPTAFIETISGEDSWSSRDGKLGPLDAIKRDQLRAQAHVRRLMLLTPLLEDKLYELSVVDEIRINDRPAVGVRVACAGERDVKLYFDEETRLLAKIEWRALGDSGRSEVVHEDIFSDYQEIDGVPTATQLLRHSDGKKTLELQYTEVHYPDRLDDAEFADPHPYARRCDVIYGRRSGAALTMDVFTPKKDAKGIAIVYLVSAGWVTKQSMIDLPLFSLFIDEPVKRGYTLFAVCPGSQPSFTIPDAIADVNQAIRYIRYHAREFAIDQRRIGVMGASSGGHLSLMSGVARDEGNPRTSDGVERTSSRVQAVGCFFPPTDFLNYGEKGRFAFAEDGVLADYRAAFDVREFDRQTKRLERIGNKEKVEELCRHVSPLTHVSAAAAPTLIIHGDADKLAPIQQSEVMVAKLKEAGVPAELVVKKGRPHGWSSMDEDMGTILDWFDKHLKK